MVVEVFIYWLKFYVRKKILVVFVVWFMLRVFIILINFLIFLVNICYGVFLVCFLSVI